MSPTLLSFHDQQHITRMFVQEQRVNAIFNQFVSAISPEMRKWRDSGNKNSVWVRNPNIENKIDRLLAQLHDNLENEIKSGQTKAWNEAVLKNDKMVESYIKGMSLSSIVKEGLFSRNLDALELLQNRTENGLNLSQRVWNITSQTKGHIETFLQGGIATGRSADAISRDFRQLLNNPDKRFRRVRNKEGKLVYSQPMKDYHPGRGVYRSSKMNAIRVSATETNMGYRMSDCERWKQLDFVLGFEVKRSRNGHPCAICDSLIGKYPKDFVFSGWHPFCICIAVPIVLEHDDFADFLLTDQIPANQYVWDIPSKAREWMNNYTRKTGEIPFFVRKNEDLLSRPARKPQYKTPVERYEIQARWNTRVAGRKYNDQLQEIKAQYGKESKVINKLVNKISNNIQDGTPVSKIDTLMGELNHKAKIKAAWNERLEINRLETLLVDVKGLKSQYTMAEIKSVYNAVETKLATWEKLSINDQIKSLKFEIEWVEKHKKYSTWKVAQDAYRKRLVQLEDVIKWKDVDAAIDGLKSFKTSSKAYIEILSDIEKSRIGGSSVQDVQDMIQKARSKQSQLLKGRNSKTFTSKTLQELKKEMGDDFPKTLENLDKKIKKYKSDWTLEQQNEALQKIREVLSNGDYGMNIPSSAVNDIFKTYFKSQIETGTGKGYVNVSYRKEASNALFGTNIKTTGATGYEKYGFLMDKDILKQANSGIADQYWSHGSGIQVRFKKDKVVATFTTCDSLSSGLYPSLTTDPKISSIYRYNSGILNKKVDHTDIIASTRTYAASYIELQYHGMLTLDCVESVYIPGTVLLKLNSTTFRAMLEHNITVYSEVGGKLITLDLKRYI